MAIEIDRERRTELVARVKQWFADELEQEIGDLKAGFVIDFLLEEVGPDIYNRAIADAQAWFHERVEDLEGSCHEPQGGSKRRRS